MFFNEETLNQNVDTSLDDVVLNKDPETAEGTDNIAKEIEANMQAAALESVIPKNIINYCGKLCNLDIERNPNLIPQFLKHMNIMCGTLLKKLKVIKA